MGTAYTVCDDSASVYHPDAGMVKKGIPLTMPMAVRLLYSMMEYTFLRMQKTV
jgi:hypothetical protein